MIEEADREEDVALYFHLNPHLSRSFKWDVMRTFKKFKEFSSSLKSEKVKPFLEDLIKNSNLKFSTIKKHASDLRIYLKEWLVISDGKLEGLMNYSRCNRVKRKQSDISIKVISEAYQQLRSLNMKEEAIFLFLTYSLCLSSKCLWFMTTGSITQNSILKCWDSAAE